MMADAFDALREADAARRQQVRDAMRLADLLHELENMPDGPGQENASEMARESAAAIRRVALRDVDVALAPPHVLGEMIDWAEDEIALYSPLDEQELRELREEGAVP